MRRRISALLAGLLGISWAFLGVNLAWGVELQRNTDPCTTVENSQYITYSGLEISSTALFRWPAMPDDTALSIPSSTVTGSAVYQIGGVQQLTVGVYSPTGLFATTGGDGSFVRGYGGLSGVGSPHIPTFLTPAQELVLFYENQWFRYEKEGDFHNFYPVDAPVKKQPAGLQIFTSTDGTAFRLVEGKCIQAAEKYKLNGTVLGPYYEQYLYEIPAGSCYIKVQLEDLRSIPLREGGSIAYSTRSPLHLASVSFVGSTLTWGALPPLPEEPSQAPPPIIPPEEGDESSSNSPPSQEESSSTPSSSEGNSSSSGENSSSDNGGSGGSGSGGGNGNNNSSGGGGNWDYDYDYDRSSSSTDPDLGIRPSSSSSKPNSSSSSKTSSSSKPTVAASAVGSSTASSKSSSSKVASPPPNSGGKGDGNPPSYIMQGTNSPTGESLIYYSDERTPLSSFSNINPFLAAYLLGSCALFLFFLSSLHRSNAALQAILTQMGQGGKKEE